MHTGSDYHRLINLLHDSRNYKLISDVIQLDMETVFSIFMCGLPINVSKKEGNCLEKLSACNTKRTI